ncbi:MAG: 4-hydroxythreonine-4-phosphate dehydrogenase PdxA [Chromatiales bacterium]|nr:4-hydroxythreonine-4-phosphate dehydrogenase PdxA [Chromatiales bacterium]
MARVTGTGPALAYTPGEPAGIGPDLILTLAASGDAPPVIVYADPDLLEQRAERLGLDVRVVPADPEHPAPAPAGSLAVWPVPLFAPVEAGVLNPANAPYVIETLRRAVACCVSGRIAGLVTGPVHKGVINDAGIGFTGHTEYLAALTDSTPVMLLAAGELRVALATTHLPLAAVPSAIAAESLGQTLDILARDLRSRLGIAEPRIAVLGLNPHAGEGGHLGREEIELIAPAIEAARERGIDARGPAPADTAFTPAQLAGVDAVLAMYHDQGLPVLKYAGFGHAVNVTLGLPIVRTSVDHGTALELAGTGRADTGSLRTAIDYARAMVARSQL